MVTIRTILAGIGATAAAGAAVVTGVSMRHSEPDSLASSLSGDVDGEVCFISRVHFFEGALEGCVNKSDIGAWGAAPVLDNRGVPITLNMSHPSDYNRDPEAVRTCVDYNRMMAEKYYAGSTREMRREAYFERACGALDYLAKAEKPKTSHFINGQCSPGDVTSLTDGPPFRIAASLKDASAAGSVDVNMDDNGVWHATNSGQKMQLQEIAHADFNGDGVGDILAHVSVGVEDATASAGMVGLLEKTSADAPVRFRQ